MAKYKTVRKDGKKGQAPSKRGLVSCVTLLVLGFALFFLLFYAMLKNS